MTARADFTGSEWALLHQGPVLAGLQVLNADKGGTIKETRAIAKLYSAARRHESQYMGTTVLIEAIVEESPHLATNRFNDPDGKDRDALCEHCADCLARAVALLQARASAEELADYRRFVLGVAQVVAEAHKEGSFLGIGGGSPVSAKEQAAIDAITTALGASTSDAPVPGIRAEP